MNNINSIELWNGNIFAMYNHDEIQMVINHNGNRYELSVKDYTIYGDAPEWLLSALNERIFKL